MTVVPTPGNTAQSPIVFRDGPIDGVVVRPLVQFTDARGWLIELFRHDQLDAREYPVMAYVSQTLPHVTRGPHEHRDQADGFAFIGPGDFKLYLWDSRSGSTTYGQRQVLLLGASQMAWVVVPAGVVHAYKNVSDVPGMVFNAPNRLYAGWGKADPVDEIRHEDQAGSPYVLD